MNVGWRFYKGSINEGASDVNFDDLSWNVVNVPHGLEIVPEEASGGINYQGEAWYRKHITFDAFFSKWSHKIKKKAEQEACKIALDLY